MLTAADHFDVSLLRFRIRSRGQNCKYMNGSDQGRELHGRSHKKMGLRGHVCLIPLHCLRVIGGSMEYRAVVHATFFVDCAELKPRL